VVDSPAFNFNLPSRTLPETQNDIRFGVSQCLDELSTIEPDWKNAFGQSRVPRQTLKNSGSDVIAKRPVRTKAVNQDALAHRVEDAERKDTG
jgi:hypothetical protein